MKAYTKEEYDRRHRQATMFEPILNAINIDTADQAQFFACFYGWYTDDEICWMMGQLGISRTPEDIKQMYEQQKRQLLQWLEQHDFYIPYTTRFAYRDAIGEN